MAIRLLLILAIGSALLVASCTNDTDSDEMMILDTDGDGVADENDNCPAMANAD